MILLFMIFAIQFGFFFLLLVEKTGEVYFSVGLSIKQDAVAVRFRFHFLFSCLLDQASDFRTQFSPRLCNYFLAQFPGFDFSRLFASVLRLGFLRLNVTVGLNIGDNLLAFFLLFQIHMCVMHRFIIHSSIKEEIGLLLEDSIFAGSTHIAVIHLLKKRIT